MNREGGTSRSDLAIDFSFSPDTMLIYSLVVSYQHKKIGVTIVLFLEGAK